MTVGFEIGRSRWNSEIERAIIRLAAAAGLVGGSIEDATNRVDDPIYEHDLSDNGVKRISTGSALSRAALGALLRAAKEMQEHGTFTFADEAVSYREISAMFEA